MNDSPRALAVVKDYDDLRLALRARADELEISRDTLTAITGLEQGYCNKLLAPVPLKHIGRISLGPLLGALGLMLIVVEDAEALSKVKSRLTKRQKVKDSASARMRPNKRYEWRKVWRGCTEWSNVMNARRTLILSSAKRSKIARKAARIRWARKRAALAADTTVKA